MQIVNIITQYYPSFFKALGITLQMTVISLLCATVLGVIFGLFKVSDFKVLKLIADVYIDIIRGTPLLVQVMIMMYGVGSVLKPYGFQWSNIGGAFTAGCVALSHCGGRPVGIAGIGLANAKMLCREFISKRDEIDMWKAW
ncbi:ABC transporter permease subunit, partial [Enterocloster bolteae]|uniref:ABC transporter permease subunit n=1 Tax=Enterocloster bolteae TaxID=208479 RepID=UPI002A7EE7E4